MSLEKAIKYGKEHRKQYYGCKAVDHECRSHGSCSFCFGGRQYKVLKKYLLCEDEPYSFRHLIRNKKHKALK